MGAVPASGEVQDKIRARVVCDEAPPPNGRKAGRKALVNESAVLLAMRGAGGVLGAAGSSGAAPLACGAQSQLQTDKDFESGNKVDQFIPIMPSIPILALPPTHQNIVN